MLRVRCRAVITNPYGSHGLLQNMQQPLFFAGSAYPKAPSHRSGGIPHPKPPWPLWGWFGEAKPGGFRRQSLRNFLPIPSSLFTKKPSPFHTGLYLRKVPTVNPSVTASPCQLPLTREPLGCSDEAPLAIVGVVWQNQTGGIPRVAGFHIGLYFEEVSAVESLSHAFAVPAPFHKGALRAVPADNFAPGFWGIVTSLPRPVSLLRHLSEQRTKAPRAIGGWFGEAKPGGFRGWQVSTWVCTLKKYLL